MANKELTARVKLDSSDAESKLKRLNTLIQSINKAVTGHANTSQLESKLGKQLIATEKVKQATLKTQIAQEKLTQEIGKSFVTEERVNQALAKTAVEQEKVKQAVSKTAQEIGKEYIIEERLNQTLKKSENTRKNITVETNATTAAASKLNSVLNRGNSHASRLLSTIKRLASTYLGVMGMKAMIGTSDTITKAQNKLNNLNGGDTQLTQQQMDKMYASANKVRMAYSDMLSNASKSMVLAGDAFQGNMDNAIRFQEIMAESYALGGASAEEMSTSMYQMIQALGSGTLAGDELRSVREGAPLAYKAVEEYVQGIMAQSEATKKFATMSLKDIAAEGLVTSEMVVAAVMDSGKRIDKQFNKTSMTFEQAWDRIKNAAIKAFEPVSNSLNKMLNDAAKNGAFEKIEQAFWNISKAIQIAFKVIYNSIVWIADNWNWLKHVIIGALIAMIAYQIIKTGISIFCAYQEMKAWMLANNVTWATIGSLLKVLGIIAVVVMAVLALVYVFYLWKTGAIDTCQAIVTALLIVAVAVLLVGLIMGNMTMLVVALVIAAIALIVQHLDYFLAIIYSVGAFIYNLVLGVINGIIQVIWSHFVEPIAGIIEWIVNAFNGGFNNIGGAFANLCGQLLSMLIGLVKPFTQILDALFGWDTTGAIESAQSAMKSWGKNENAITYSLESPTIGSLTGGAVPDRIAYTDAWNTGMAHGGAAKNGINEWGAQFQTGFGSFDNLGKGLGLDFGNLTGFPSVGDGKYDTGGAYKSPSADDMIKNALGDISDDTGSIADSMELTDEDLSYLRKIAEMEWKKEYTTASIKVDMSNYNTVNGESDLDGIVTKLADKLYEEMNVVANGVYA